MRLAKVMFDVLSSSPFTWLLGVVLARTHVKGSPSGHPIFRERSENLLHTGLSGKGLLFPWPSGFNLRCKGQDSQGRISGLWEPEMGTFEAPRRNIKEIQKHLPIKA